jgi:hypothetical protein
VCIIPGVLYSILFDMQVAQESPLLLVQTAFDIRFLNGHLERHAMLVKDRRASLVLIIDLVSRLDVALIRFVGFALASGSLGFVTARFPLQFIGLESLLGRLVHPSGEFQALQFWLLKHLLLIYHIAILGWSLVGEREEVWRLDYSLYELK